jgi:dihydroorotate dehydrogenase electron transfer subunit
VENRDIGPGLFWMTLAAPRISEASPPEPGQFLHILPGPGRELFMRRPISVLDFDPARGRIELYVQVFGPGSALIAGSAPGTTLDCLGSLGRGFTPAAPGHTIYMVAGGVGLAPLYFWWRELARGPRPPRVELLLGARTAGLIPRGGLLETLPGTVRLATEDGSAGFQGTVIDLLESLLDRESAPVELAGCGPTAMLAALESVASRRALRVQICMEQVMGCAMGACQGCVVPARLAGRPSGSGEGYARVCTEGPVFEGGEVDWGSFTGHGHFAGAAR